MIAETVQAEPTSLSWEQVWILAVLHPSPATFEKLIKDPAATPRRAYKWMFFTTMIIIAIALPLQYFLGGNANLKNLAAQSNYPASTWIVVWIVLIPVCGLLSILGLMIEAARLQWIAGWLGGSGYYEDLVYALAAFEVPLGVASALISVIPVIGGLSQLLSFYSFLLALIAIKTVNQFSWGKAVWCVVLPGLILIVLAILFGICMVASLGRG